MAIRLRSGTIDDVETFTRLVNAQHQWLRGEDLWEAEELSSILISPSSDPVRYDRYIDVDGVAVAGLHTHVSAPFNRATIHLASPPGELRMEYASQLIEASLRILRSRPEVPPEATVQIDVAQEDIELARLLIASGFIHSDDVVVLEADISDTRPAVWPVGISGRTLEPATDLDLSFNVMSVSFMPEPGGWHVTKEDFLYMLNKDPTALPGLSVMAVRDDKPAGIAMNFVDTTRAETGLVGMLGVMPELRGHGIGKALLLESFSQFREQGWSSSRLATITGHRARDLQFFQSVGLKPIYVNQVYLRPVH